MLTSPKFFPHSCANARASLSCMCLGFRIQAKLTTTIKPNLLEHNDLPPNPLPGARTAERAAFAAFYTAHYRALFDFANSILRDKALADDLVAETFLKLWNH